ncbi:hypothetical protein F3087_35520 [Nocardia colli]|uniref:Uncharacterized protein n=1 Tax=Nocardia colli TaxID=2545717 RepID=A0A5N0E4R9_9NOCA|nr:hypothetical protein [Nocardia colli]KAA8883983.1 hypothetical protein F3087_35520 [Nocardia colli]
MTALIATGIATEHGPSPENQAAILTATMTDLPPLAPVTEPAADTQQPVTVGRHAWPVRPTIDADALPDLPSSDKVGPTGLGLPLTPAEPTALPGRTNTPRPHHQADTAARPNAQIALPPLDLTALLTNISAALNAGAVFAESLQSGSAALTPTASKPAAPSSTESDSVDSADTAKSAPAESVQMAAPATDLTSLLATVTAALKVGAALAQGLESGSSILGPGSAALTSGSAALDGGSSIAGAGSSILDGGSSIAGTGSSILGPLAAVLTPLSAAAAASA